MALAIMTCSDAPELRAGADQGDGPAALTPRGEAAVLVLRLEQLWPGLATADRAYVAGALADLARRAREVGS